MKIVMQHYAKFQTVFETGSVGDSEKIKQLLFWARKFQQTGLVPDPKIKKGGNLSFRAGDGFIITPSAINFDDITPGDFVRVVGVDHSKNIVKVIGNRVPASETPLHHAIYKHFPNAGAVFHGECPSITSNANELGVIVTKQFQPYGTEALVNEVLGCFISVPGARCVVMRNHGEVYIGECMEDAGETALGILRLAKSKGYH